MQMIDAADDDERLRRQLRALKRAVGNPSDAKIAKWGGPAPATISEVMSGKRRPGADFIVRFVQACLVVGRRARLAEPELVQVLRALRLPGGSGPAIPPFLERAEDLDRCSEALERAQTRSGSTIVITGEAGIGKTALIEHIRAEAAVRSIAALSAVGSESRRHTGLHVVRSLLAPWVAGRPKHEQQQLFREPAALARIALGMQAAPPGRMDTSGQLDALYWLAVHTSELIGTGQPTDALLLTVDDAQWVDLPSLVWLDRLSEQATGMPLVIVLAYRSGPGPAACELQTFLLRARHAIELRALSEAAVRRLVQYAMVPRHDNLTPSGSFCQAVLRHTGGNPFYLHWTLRMARAKQVPPTADGVELVNDLAPSRVVKYLGRLLASLGPAAQQLARSTAILGPDCTLVLVAQLAGLSILEAKGVYDQLCDVAILTPGPQVAFCHPIIQRAVHDDMPPTTRSDLHRAAAALRHESHHDTATIAAHLLFTHASGDSWVTDRLLAAADEAMAIGLADSAASYLRRAVVEPPPPTQRALTRLRLGQALALGPIAAAIPELHASYQTAPTRDQLVDAAIALAKTYGYANRLGDAVRLLGSALSRCDSTGRRTQLLAEQLLWATWWAGDPDRTARAGELARLVRQDDVDGYPARLLTTLYALIQVFRGDPSAAAMATIQPVIDEGLRFADAKHGMELATIAAFIPMFAGQLDLARQLFDDAVAQFDRHGWRGTHLAFARTHQANVALRQGRLSDAIADAQTALRLADRAGEGTPAEWFATGTLIQALIARGEISAARKVSEQRQYDATRPDALVLPIPQAVLGTLLLATRRTSRGIATLQQVGAYLDAAGMTNPAWCSWRFDLAMALRTTSPTDATVLAQTAAEQADRFGCPSMVGRSRRVLAAVIPRSALALLREAVDALQMSPDQLELARACADLGAELLRTDRRSDGLGSLVRALDLARVCGADALHRNIIQQLARAGKPCGMPPPRYAHDPTVQRIARLWNRGLSVEKIAHDLVLDLDEIHTLLRRAGIPNQPRSHQ